MTAQHIDDAGAPSRALFARVGEALYGPCWQESMAAVLGISSRSVRYWVAGRYAIPAGVWPDLRDAVMLHREELAGLLDEIPE